jgi:SAM-dependent methyltransferase
LIDRSNRPAHVVFHHTAIERKIRLLALYWKITRIFEIILRIALNADSLESLLAAQVNPRPGQRILVTSCGTGRLVRRIKRVHPETVIIAIDPDPVKLCFASIRFFKPESDVELHRATADEAPFPERSFDYIFCNPLAGIGADKQHDFSRMLALLRRGGELRVGEWQSWMGYLAARLGKTITNTEERKQPFSSADRLLPIIEQAGFCDLQKTQYHRAPLGVFHLYRAVAP